MLCAYVVHLGSARHILRSSKSFNICPFVCIISAQRVIFTSCGDNQHYTTYAYSGITKREHRMHEPN
jgi:hypothetical protein